MSHRHDQNHPLYNRSNFRYRASPQSPRVVLGVSLAVELGRAFADAPRGDGKRFVVRADEKLTAFVELEAAIRSCGLLA